MITAAYARETTVIIAPTVILKMSEDSAPNVLREFITLWEIMHGIMLFDL